MIDTVFDYSGKNVNLGELELPQPHVRFGLCDRGDREG
jgi:hypothetical protein